MGGELGALEELFVPGALVVSDGVAGGACCVCAGLALSDCDWPKAGSFARADAAWKVPRKQIARRAAKAAKSLSDLGLRADSISG